MTSVSVFSKEFSRTDTTEIENEMQKKIFFKNKFEKLATKNPN